MKSSKFKKKYKALMVDVDGTLIIKTRNGIPSTHVTKAVNKASQILHVGVATSRCLPITGHIIKHLHLSGPSILSGGAQVIDTTSKKVFMSEPILKKDIHTIYDLVRRTKNTWFVCNGNGTDTLISQKSIKDTILQIFTSPLSHTDAQTYKKKLTGISTIATHTTPSWEKDKYNIIITHTAATKQHGILEVAKILGIDTHEMIGVGDGGNDMPLLMACGLKVAMGNAVDDLKAIADYVAPTVENDGVADVIEKFVL